MTISERIKYIRMNQPSGKLSREAFAQSLGLSKDAVYNLEDAENRLPNGIPDSTIKLICATYNVNYQWLTEGREPMYLLSEGEELIAKYAPAAPEHLKTAIRTLSELPDEYLIVFRDILLDMVSVIDGVRKDP